MEELASRLIALLSIKTIDFDESDGWRARAIAAQQKDLYQTLMDSFRRVTYNEGRGNSGVVSASPIAEAIFSSTLAILDNDPPRAHQQGGARLSVVSGAPILEDASVQDLRKFLLVEHERRSIRDASQYALFFAAALAVEMQPTNLFAQVEVNTFQREHGIFLSQVAAYAAAKAVESKSKDIRIELGVETRNTLDQLDDELGKARGQLENYQAEFDHQKAEQRLQLNSLSAASVDIIESQKNLQQEIEDSRSRLTSFESAMREELRLQHARLTWETRFKEARLGFQIACCLLVAFLVVTIGTAILFGPDFIVKLAKMEKDATIGDPSIAIALTHQFGRLIVFSVPVIVYLWMLRAVMRFFMRSMLLMDDARQRQTMLDTYFLLSEKGRADERDRPLILWALFRQTPGHGPDGVEPPDFTEVINAGLKRSAAGE